MLEEKITVKHVVLPETVKGCVTVLEDNHFLILINDSLSEEDQHEALEHELEHIRRGDLEDENKKVSDIENEVHRIIKGSV